MSVFTEDILFQDIMKTLRSILFGCLAVGTGFAAQPVTIFDERGDAEFSGAPLPAFDLVSLTFEEMEDDRLKVIFTGDGPMADLGTTYSWFAVWIDLDSDLRTAGPMKRKNLGCDIILGAESTRGVNGWTGQASGQSDLGKEMPVEFEKAWAEGNQVFAIFKSEFFSKYPIFKAAAFAHHDGEFVDILEGGEMDRIAAFDPTADSVPAPASSFQELFDVSNGRCRNHQVPLPPETSKLEIAMTPRAGNRGPRWRPFFGIAIEDQEDGEERIRIGFSQKIEDGPFIGSVDTFGLRDDEKIDIESEVQLEEKVVIGFEWTSARVKIFVNGQEVESLRLPFDPTMSTVFVSSAVVFAEGLVVE